MLIHDMLKLMNGNNLPAIGSLIKDLLALVVAIRSLISYIIELLNPDDDNKDAKP